jgi:hypothetical protein
MKVRRTGRSYRFRNAAGELTHDPSRARLGDGTGCDARRRPSGEAGGRRPLR